MPDTHQRLECRQANPADGETLSELGATVFRAAYRSAFNSDQQMEAFISERLAPTSFRTDLNDGTAWCSLGLVDGVPAGFIQMKESDSPECVGDLRAMELWKLYVLQRFHGCGIADVLMERGIERATEDGAAQVWLCVWENSPRAQAFYRRHGFSAVGEMPHTWGGVLFRDIVMTRLTAPDSTR